MKRRNHLRPLRSGHNGADRWRFGPREERILCRCRLRRTADTRCIPLPGSRYPGNGTIGNIVITGRRPVTGYPEKRHNGPQFCTTQCPMRPIMLRTNTLCNDYSFVLKFVWGNFCMNQNNEHFTLLRYKC